MRVLVILNPRADMGRGARYRDQILAAGGERGDLTLVSTDGPGHAVELAAAAARDGVDVVAAAGGDGTVHEVVNGLVRVAGASTALGVIPIGSGNDFAYAHGLPTEPGAAVQRLYDGRLRRIDLARIEDEHGRARVFDNNCGVGFDAQVVIETEKITRVHGFLMYLLAVLRTIVWYYERPQLTIMFDDEEVNQRILFLALGVGPRGGGGFLLVPDASPEDNLVDSCLVNPIGRLHMLWMIPKTLNGSHVTSRHVSMRQNRRIVIRANRPIPVHVDGEVFAYPADLVQRLEVSSLPGALEVMV